MKIYVINLDRSVERLAQFRAHNPSQGLILRASAIDGRTVDPQVFIDRGLLSPALRYGAGALGHALSQLRMWKHTADGHEPVTVLEDDAVLCRNFREESQRIIDGLTPGWDYIFWGYNFDTYMTFEVLAGVSTGVITFDQDRMRAGLAGFHGQDVTTTAFRLICALGTPGYTVSPAGAARLLAACLPLRPSERFYPGMNRIVPNVSLDYAMNECHPTFAAYVALPPLVLTANDHSISTIQEGSHA